MGGDQGRRAKQEVAHLWRPSPVVLGVWDLDSVGCVFPHKDQWLARLRSGATLGPFPSVDDAKLAVEDYVDFPRDTENP